jgi:hypothetical protein
MAAEYARLQIRISSEIEAWEDVSYETDGYRVPVAFNTAKDGSGDWLVPLLDSDAHLQVDVLSGGGAGTQYTEDAAAAANPTGTMPVLVRADSPAGVTSTDGDVVAQRATDYGAAFVQIVDSSGNFVDSFGGAGGTAAADDADFVAGTTQGTPVQGVYESSPSSVTDGDLGMIGITQTRAVRVSIDDDTSGGVEIVQDTAGDLNMTADTELPAAAALGDTDGNPTAPAVGSFLMGWDTSQWTRLRTTIGDGSVATGILNVVPMVYNGTTYDRLRGSTDGVDIGDISAGTQTNDVKVSLDSEDVTSGTHGNFLVNATLQLADTDVSATNPVPVRPNEYELAGNTTHVKKYYTASTPTDGIVWSPAAGKRWYITDIFIGVSAASTVTLEDDLTAGDDAVWKHELAANSGWDHTFETPLYSGEDAADLIITASAGTVYVMITGYEI